MQALYTSPVSLHSPARSGAWRPLKLSHFADGLPWCEPCTAAWKTVLPCRPSRRNGGGPCFSRSSRQTPRRWRPTTRAVGSATTSHTATGRARPRTACATGTRRDESAARRHPCRRVSAPADAPRATSPVHRLAPQPAPGKLSAPPLPARDRGGRARGSASGRTSAGRRGRDAGSTPGQPSVTTGSGSRGPSDVVRAGDAAALAAA